VIYFVTHVFITLTRHPDPERSEGEGPHSLHVITTPVGGGTSCNVHAKHELPIAHTIYSMSSLPRCATLARFGMTAAPSFKK
jgi:hypothetical protein